MSQPFTLDVIRVATPCHAAWDSMTGDARVRHCGECQKNVYNLSEMSRAEAEALVTKHEGRLCVRFFQRSDGTLLTADCPVGLLAAARRRLAGWFAAAAAGLLTLAAFGGALARGRGTIPTMGQPVVMGKMAPVTVSNRAVMGEAEICIPPPTPAPVIEDTPEPEAR